MITGPDRVRKGRATAGAGQGDGGEEKSSLGKRLKVVE